ncbi:hypothetical protein [Xanthomonas axonopodis]|uniref:hypothetical protein n=1 Tax=Xanthomonas axonopodis TaxID=53413 RepID=UPI0011179E6A|nr:hypothetical protein [Xanthomonas axonopodis]
MGAVRGINWSRTLKASAWMVAGAGLAFSALGLIGPIHFGKDAPAWVQAVGSVLAIMVAVGLPYWHEARNSRTRSRDLVELMMYALSVASMGKKILQDPEKRSRGWAVNSFDTVIGAMRSVNYLDTPHPVLAISLQQTQLVMTTLASYIEHARKIDALPTQTQLDTMFDRHIRVIESAIEYSTKTTGAKARALPPPPFES